MKRTQAVLLIALLVALVATSPVLAAGGNGGTNGGGNGAGQRHQERNGTPQGNPLPGANFALVGIITAKADDALIIQVYGGNRFVKEYIGAELAVVLTEATRYRQWTPDRCVPISFDEVEVGDTASVRGTLADGIFTATRVTVDVPCCTP